MLARRITDELQLFSTNVRTIIRNLLDLINTSKWHRKCAEDFISDTYRFSLLTTSIHFFGADLLLPFQGAFVEELAAIEMSATCPHAPPPRTDWQRIAEQEGMNGQSKAVVWVIHYITELFAFYLSSY